MIALLITIDSTDSGFVNLNGKKLKL